MATLPLNVNAVPADIGATLSAAIAAENPVGSSAGRGVVRLCNTDDSATIYLAVQVGVPDGTVPGVPVRVGEWFPEDLEITPDGGLWAWTARAEAKVTALVTRWS